MKGKETSTKLYESKTEYTSRLVHTLKAPILEELYVMYSNSKKESDDSNDEDNILVNFQEKLEKVVDLDDEKKNDITRKIRMSSKCEYIEELLQATFILHTRILQIDEKLESDERLEIKVPAVDEFIFESLVNACRKVWKFAFLFIDTQNNVEYQKNSIELEYKIEESIIDTIGSLLPIKQILEENLKKYKEMHADLDSDSDSDSDSESDSESDKKMSMFPKHMNKYNGGVSVVQNAQQNMVQLPQQKPISQQITSIPAEKTVDIQENLLSSLDSTVETFNFDDADFNNDDTEVSEPIQHNVSFAPPPNVELKNINV